MRALRRMSRLGVVFLVSGLVGLPMTQAAKAAASKAQCTCDLETAGDRKDGAEVGNAAACYLTEVETRDWCDFDVDALTGSSRHEQRLMSLTNGLLNADAPAQTQRLLGFLAEGMAAGSIPIQLKFQGYDVEAALAEMQQLLEQSAEQLDRCLTAYVDPSSSSLDGVELLEGKGFACGIHPDTGWLNLVFRFDGWTLTYLTVPPSGR